MILTGLDLPATAPGGSVELFHDLYTRRPRAPLGAHSWPWMLGPRQPPGCELTLLDGSAKNTDGPAFDHYVSGLAQQIRTRAPRPDVLHLHHLAFGASPALVKAWPHAAAIALIHGTDLLYARHSHAQHTVLTDIAHHARYVVAPTPAMADQLRTLAPTVDARKIVHIRWGVPDALLTDPPARSEQAPGPLRLLYAGRLSPEKGVQELITACARSGARLSVAAPDDPQLEGVHYLGWLPRARLWQEFSHHDLLVVPSNTLEACGLVALEAQACGLPVLYHDVPGLADTLGESAIAVPSLDGHALRSTLAWLHADPEALAQARHAGYRNAARHPLNSTATALTQLCDQA